MTNHPEAALMALEHQLNNTERLVLSVICHLHGTATEFGAVNHELRQYFGRLREELAAILRQIEAGHCSACGGTGVILEPDEVGPGAHPVETLCKCKTSPPDSSQGEQECLCPQHGNWIAAEDVKRLARDMDVAMFGENAAPAPSLCDVAASVIDYFGSQGEPVAWRLQTGISIPLYFEDEESARGEAKLWTDRTFMTILEPLYTHPSSPQVAVADAWLDAEFLLIEDPNNPDSPQTRLEFGLATGVPPNARVLLHRAAPQSAEP